MSIAPEALDTPDPVDFRVRALTEGKGMSEREAFEQLGISGASIEPEPEPAADPDVRARPLRARRSGGSTRSFESDRDAGWNASEGVTPEKRENTADSQADGLVLRESVLEVVAERPPARKAARLLGLGPLTTEVEEGFRKRLRAITRVEE